MKVAHVIVENRTLLMIANKRVHVKVNTCAFWKHGYCKRRNYAILFSETQFDFLGRSCRNIVPSAHIAVFILRLHLLLSLNTLSDNQATCELYCSECQTLFRFFSRNYTLAYSFMHSHYFAPLSGVIHMHVVALQYTRRGVHSRSRVGLDYHSGTLAINRDAT